MQNEYRFRMLEKKVKMGYSPIYENWHSATGVSMENFLDGLKWVYEDPLKDFGVPNEGPRMTRELGCTTKGELIKLRRVYDELGGFIGIYTDVKLGSLWSGPSINCRDQI